MGDFGAYMANQAASYEAANTKLRAELERQAAEIKRLREALKECSDDLQTEIDGRYMGSEMMYPTQRRKYDRDCGPVVNARKLLGNEQTTVSEDQK